MVGEISAVKFHIINNLVFPCMAYQRIVFYETDSVYLENLDTSWMSANNRLKDIPKKVFFFYFDGFRSMTVGRKLWIIILIKLFIMFAILKTFFFQDFLKTRFDSDEERSRYVIEELTKTNNKNHD